MKFITSTIIAIFMATFAATEAIPVLPREGNLAPEDAQGAC